MIVVKWEKLQRLSTHFFNKESFSAIVMVKACAMILSWAARAVASAHAIFSWLRRVERWASSILFSSVDFLYSSSDADNKAYVRIGSEGVGEGEEGVGGGWGYEEEEVGEEEEDREEREGGGVWRGEE